MGFQGSNLCWLHLSKCPTYYTIAPTPTSGFLAQCLSLKMKLKTNVESVYLETTVMEDEKNLPDLPIQGIDGGYLYRKLVRVGINRTEVEKWFPETGRLGADVKGTHNGFEARPLTTAWSTGWIWSVIMGRTPGTPIDLYWMMLLDEWKSMAYGELISLGAKNTQKHTDLCGQAVGSGSPEFLSVRS